MIPYYFWEFAVSAHEYHENAVLGEYAHRIYSACLACFSDISEKQSHDRNYYDYRASSRNRHHYLSRDISMGIYGEHARIFTKFFLGKNNAQIVPEMITCSVLR
jgi:hypothetical protein